MGICIQEGKQKVKIVVKMVKNLQSLSVQLNLFLLLFYFNSLDRSISNSLGPVVQSIVSLTSSLRVILLTVLAGPMYNILIFFAEKM